MIAVFFIVLIVTLINSRSLLSILLLLELLGFFVVYFVCVSAIFSIGLDFLVMSVFCILVMEGVISLCTLIQIVSFSGMDYLLSSSILNL